MKSITFKKEKDKIVIEIPFWSARSNPWMDESPGDYPTLTGLVMIHNKDGNDWDEMGFAYTIDMDYKDKADQYTDIMFHFGGEQKDFEKLCAKLGIGVVVLED